MRLTAVPEGLDLCFGFLRQVPFQQVRLAAAFQSGRPQATPQLMLILGGQDRPFIVKASGIDFQSFGLPSADSDGEALRGFISFLARQHPSLTVPEETARFSCEGGLETLHASAVPSLATSLRVLVDPELSDSIQRLSVSPKAAVPIVADPKAATSDAESRRRGLEQRARAPSSALPTEAIEVGRGTGGTGQAEAASWQHRLTMGLDSLAPPPPLLPPFGPALRFGPRRRGELLKGFAEDVPDVELSRAERAALPFFAAAMWLVPLLYLASIVALSYAIYHFASTDGQALVEGAVAETWEAGSFSFLLIIGLCIYLIFALLSPLFTRQPKERHRLNLPRGQELVLFGFVDYLAKLMDTPIPQRIEVMEEPDVSAYHRRKDDQSREFVLLLGLPLVAGLSLGELVGLMSRELSAYAYRPGGDLLLSIARQHRRNERMLADFLTYHESLGRRLDERLEEGGVGFFAAVFSFMAFVFFSSTRWVVTFFVKLSEWLSLVPRRWSRRDAERFQRQVVGNGVTDSGLDKQRRLGEAHRQFIADVDDLGKGRDGEEDGPVVLDHLPVQLVMTSVGGADPVKRPSLGTARVRQVIFTSSLPATVLLQDFFELSRKATVDFFRSQDVRGLHLQPVEEFFDRWRDEQMHRPALHRFFGGTISSRRPIPVAPEIATKERSTKELMTIVAAQRRKFEASLDGYRGAVEDFDVIVDCRLGAREAFKLVELDFEHQGMGVDEWKSMEQDALLRLQDLSVTLETYERQAGQRLMSALSPLADPDTVARLDDGERWSRRVPRLLQAVAEINGSFRSLLELRDRHAVLATLRSIETRKPEDKRLLLELYERDVDTLYPPIVALYKGLESALDLFHISGCDIGLMAHGVANDYFDLASDVLRRIYDVYFRSLAELATIAEQVEAAAGFDPLEDRGPFPEARPWRS